MSLTTIPARWSSTAVALSSLLHQALRPDLIYVWYDRRSHGVPERMRRLARHGVRFSPCEDLGPHTKLVHCLRRHPDDLVVTADDDVVYPHAWLRTLYEAWRDDPAAIVCCRAHRIAFRADGYPAPYADWEWDTRQPRPSLDLFPTGTYGVLYAPGALSEQVHDYHTMRALTPTADDVWFKVMSLLNRTPCRVVPRRGLDFYTVAGSQEVSLFSVNVGQHANDPQIRAAFAHFDLRGPFDE